MQAHLHENTYPHNCNGSQKELEFLILLEVERMQISNLVG